jgi:hypothetical protein
MAAPKPQWNAYFAGVALGVVLFAAFLATGHGLGVTGATTGVTAVAANAAWPGIFGSGSYLAGYVRFGLNHWIEWEVLGVLVGGLAGSLLGRRFAPRLDGPPRAGAGLKLLLAFAGGGVSGFGARMAMGCTSGMGLSGSAPLAAAGFLFLIGFFVAAALTALPLKPLWRRR